MSDFDSPSQTEASPGEIAEASNAPVTPVAVAPTSDFEALEQKMAEAAELDARWTAPDPMAAEAPPTKEEWNGEKVEVETQAEVVAAPETVAPIVPAVTPIPDRIDRLAELVERLVTPPQPEQTRASTEVERAEYALKMFDGDAKYRSDVLAQLGYKRPEHLEDPHAYHVASSYLERQLERAQRTAEKAEFEAFKAEQASIRAAAEQSARELFAEQSFNAALSNFGPVPARTLSALTAAVKAQVNRGVSAADAIQAVMEHFGEVLPKKAPAAPAARATDPKQVSRDRAMATAPRVAPSKTRNLEQELRRLEGGRWS